MNLSYKRTISELGENYTAKADQFAIKAQYQNSNYYLKKAIPLYKKTGNWDKMVACYIKLGNNFRETEDFEEALKCLDEALDLAVNHLAEKPLYLAKDYIKLAYRFFHQKREYQRALTLYQKALAIHLEVLGKNHPDVAKIFNSMALLYWNLGEDQKAWAYYNRSFSIKLRGLKNRNAELNQSYKFLDKGAPRKGVFDQELEEFRATLRQNLAAYGEDHPLVADIRENLGILHTFEGNYERAMEELYKSLTIRLSLLGADDPKTASSYHNIGVCHRMKKDFGMAKQFFLDALEIKLKHRGETAPETADTYFQLGLLYSGENEFDEALKCFQEAMVDIIPGFSDLEIYANPDISSAHSRDKLLQVLAAKAQVLRKRSRQHPDRAQDLHLSLATYLLASRLIDHLRSGYKSESYKLFFGSKCMEIYSGAISTALALYKLEGNPEFKHQAFIFSEKSKAAVLAEAVSDSQAKKYSNIPDHLLAREQKLKMELALYDTYLEKEQRKKGRQNMVNTRSIEEHYFKLEGEYRNLVGFLEENYENYYNLKYQSRLMSIPALQEHLDPDTALIEYFVGDGTLHIFLLTGQDLHVLSQDITPHFSQLIEDFNNSIKKIEERRFLDFSHRLYRELVAPISGYLENKQKIVIIPHDQLFLIPFEALISSPASGSDFSRVDYLIKKYSFNYHYSAGLWLEHFRWKSKNRPMSIVGLAPVFSDTANPGYILNAQAASQSDNLEIADNTRDVVLDEMGIRLPELPATEDELAGIINLFKEKKKKAVGYFHQRATEAVIKDPVMKNYSFIHIATHSLQSRESSKLSGLVFSKPSSSDTGEDGILYSGEIYSLNLDARLVVLSSCESGVGRLIKGEGMIALARSFFYAGVRNIIFSLWKVEDRSTSQLMIELYRGILSGRPLAQALRRAKLSLTRNRFTAFPKYWSGFILVGN